MTYQRTLILSQLGNALTFDGSTTTCRRSGVLSSSQNDWSCTAWIYLSGTPGSTTTLVKNGETGTGNGGWKFGITTASRLNLSDPGGAWGGTASTALSNTTWYHVAFIRSGTSTQMYVNAVSDGSAITGSFNACQVDFTIGCTRSSSTGLYSAIFNGLIDDVRVWTRAITVDELIYIYTQDQIHTASTTSLQGWWKMDETSGDALDSSGNSRTMTVANGVYATGIAYIANIPARTVAGARTPAGTRTVATA